MKFGKLDEESEDIFGRRFWHADFAILFHFLPTSEHQAENGGLCQTKTRCVQKWGYFMSFHECQCNDGMMRRVKIVLSSLKLYPKMVFLCDFCE
jgi:hypothetical protein